MVCSPQMAIFLLDDIYGRVGRLVLAPASVAIAYVVEDQVAIRGMKGHGCADSTGGLSKNMLGLEGWGAHGGSARKLTEDRADDLKGEGYSIR